MAFYGLRLEYALDGSSNYIAWKDRIEDVLEDNGLKDLIDQEFPKLTDATQLEEWKKCVARARRIFLEGVQDHIVSSLHGKVMWEHVTQREKVFQLIPIIQKNLQAREWGPLAYNFHVFSIKDRINLEIKHANIISDG